MRRRRLPLAGLAAAVIAAGLAVRFAMPAAIWTDAAGDILYAMLSFLLVAFLAPRLPVAGVAAIAFSWCSAVELLQLTGAPARWAAVVPVVALVFGSGFAATDLLCYLAGVLIAASVDALVARRSVRGPGPRPTGAPASR